jgi:hypothetical protein
MIGQHKPTSAGGHGSENRGQASLEFFLLLAAIAVLTVISSQSLWPTVRDALQGSNGFFARAADGLVNADQ